MAQPNYISIQYTEPNKGEPINFAYHDFVISLNGLQSYQEWYNFVNFKYVLEVRVNGFLAATMKAPPTSANQPFALFNIRAIVEDYVQSDQSGYARTQGFDGVVQSRHKLIGFQQTPHAIHMIDRYARNKSNLQDITFRIGAEWFLNGVFNQVLLKYPKISNKSNALPKYYFWNSVLQFRDLQQGQSNYDDYILDGTNKQFLTRKLNNVVRKVTKTDYETLGFLNGRWKFVSGNGGHQTPLININSGVYDIFVRAFGIQPADNFDMIIPNTATNGGSLSPIFSLNSSVQPPFTDEGLLYVGVGCKNLANNGLNDTDGNPVTETTFDGISNYQVFARNIASQKISQIYNFEVVTEECTYERIRIAYLNSLGAWDYFSFAKKSTRSTDITRSNYKANYGYTPLRSQPNINVGNDWEYGSYEGGTRSYNVNAIQTIEANSDWLTDAEAQSLEELFVSPVAYIQNGESFEAVSVTEKDYTLQTTANDKLKQYIITIQYGHETRVQRL